LRAERTNFATEPRRAAGGSSTRRRLLLLRIGDTRRQYADESEKTSARNGHRLTPPP
jgi:hypothetical protein